MYGITPSLKSSKSDMYHWKALSELYKSKLFEYLLVGRRLVSVEKIMFENVLNSPKHLRRYFGTFLADVSSCRSALSHRESHVKQGEIRNYDFYRSRMRRMS